MIYSVCVVKCSAIADTVLGQNMLSYLDVDKTSLNFVDVST